MDFPVYNPERYSAVQNVLPSKLNYSRYHNQSRSRPAGNISDNVDPQYQPHISNISEKVKSETVKGDSRIEYVPFEKKVIDYVDEQKCQVIPKKKTIKDYRDHLRVEMVPKQVTVTDYYAVEHIRCYIPQIIPEKKIEYVPYERKNIKYQYIPVERQIVHYPNHSHEEEAPKYLGVRSSHPAKRYQNMSDQDFEYWEREYGYQRGESVQQLNQRIRQKHERQKEMFFKQFQGSNVSTLPYSSYHQSRVSPPKNIPLNSNLYQPPVNMIPSSQRSYPQPNYPNQTSYPSRR